MKTDMHWGQRHFVFLGIIVMGLISFSTAHAQTPTTLYSFTGGNDGQGPQGDLILSGSTLYGTANGGGSSNAGTVFSVPVTGGSTTTLASFSYSDGAYPQAGLTLSGSTLYGTTYLGGHGSGTVFSVPVTGGTPTTLYEFTGTGTDGYGPSSNLILSGSTLYGTTQYGGTADKGTVFSVPVTGGPATTLYSFTATGTDGESPAAGLVLSGSTLYGTTQYGGTDNSGTVFSVPVTGGPATTLYSFTGSGTDGADPAADLTLDGSDLYGTTEYGGTDGYGTVFSVPVTGGPATTIYSFTGTGTDGEYPAAGLILSGSTLYGTTSAGGTDGDGTVFALDLSPSAAPEPSTWTLLLVGLGVLAWVRRRKITRNGQV